MKIPKRYVLAGGCRRLFPLWWRRGATGSRRPLYVMRFLTGFKLGHGQALFPSEKKAYAFGRPGDRRPRATGEHSRPVFRSPKIDRPSEIAPFLPLLFIYIEASARSSLSLFHSFSLSLSLFLLILGWAIEASRLKNRQNEKRERERSRLGPSMAIDGNHRVVNRRPFPRPTCPPRKSVRANGFIR